MFEFYRLSPHLISVMVIIFTLCVIAQTVAMLMSFNRYVKTAVHWVENLLEVFILFQNILLSLLLSRIATDMNASLIVVSGYMTPRYGVFAVLTVFTLLVCILRRLFLPFIVIPAGLLTLPFSEAFFGRYFPSIYILILIFWTGRAIYICVQRQRELRHEISAFSIKEAMEVLHTGLLYYNASNGRAYLANRRMEKLMIALTGTVQRNGRKFWQSLQSGDTLIKPESQLLDGQMVFLLENNTAWLFSENRLVASVRSYMQISAVDVTERWRLTHKLWQQEQELLARGEKLSVTLENLEAICRDEQLVRMQSKVHDAMAQRLAVLMRILRADQSFSEAKLKSFADDLFTTASNDIKASSYDPEGIAVLCRAYEDIGITVNIQGYVPVRPDIAAFYTDFIYEGIANAVRHGFATEVFVVCKTAETGLLMSVTNAGIAPSGNIIEGGGLTELRRRLDEINGELSVTTRPQFTITATIHDFAERRKGLR